MLLATGQSRAYGFVRVVSVHDEVRVVDGLPQPGQQVEDVRIVVQQRALVHIVVEPRARLLVDAVVEVALALVQLILADFDAQRRQQHLRRALRLSE